MIEKPPTWESIKLPENDYKNIVAYKGKLYFSTLDPKKLVVMDIATEKLTEKTFTFDVVTGGVFAISNDDYMWNYDLATGTWRRNNVIGSGGIGWHNPTITGNPISMETDNKYAYTLTDEGKLYKTNFMEGTKELVDFRDLGADVKDFCFVDKKIFAPDTKGKFLYELDLSEDTPNTKTHGILISLTPDKEISSIEFNGWQLCMPVTAKVQAEPIMADLEDSINADEDNFSQMLFVNPDSLRAGISTHSLEGTIIGTAEGEKIYYLESKKMQVQSFREIGMTEVLGNVYYSPLREMFSPSYIALEGIDVTLTTPDGELTTITDSTGYFEFNVEWQDVEFNLSIKKPTLDDIKAITDVPINVNAIDWITPSIWKFVPTTASNQHQFALGPVIYTPLEDSLDDGVVINPDNLIVLADHGTFGLFPLGTPANTGAGPMPPYPEIASWFSYVQPIRGSGQLTPSDGEYTVQNIMNDSSGNVANAWWRIADHATGDESGRFMAVNGHYPEKTIFSEKVVTIKPNTYYLFSAWVLNLMKKAGADPAFGVRILDENDEEFYNANLGQEIPYRTDAPEWKQIGTVLYSGNNSALTIQFISMGPAADGNDYAIDDIELHEIGLITYNPVKSIDKPYVKVGDKVTFTITLHNPVSNPFENIRFSDILQDGLKFVEGSVIVNNIACPDMNPNVGFTIPLVPSGETLTITFETVATHEPEINPVPNKAQVNYDYSPIEGGILNTFETETNEVMVVIIPTCPDCPHCPECPECPKPPPCPECSTPSPCPPCHRPPRPRPPCPPRPKLCCRCNCLSCCLSCATFGITTNTTCKKQ